VAISHSLILSQKIATLRLLPWMACMQKMQEYFSVAMTVIHELIRGSLEDFWIPGYSAYNTKEKECQAIYALTKPVNL